MPTILHHHHQRHSHSNIETIFAINPVSDNEVFKLTCDLMDSATGWDKWRPNMIKHAKEHIKFPLAHICNLQYVETDVFPVIQNR